MDRTGIGLLVFLIITLVPLTSYSLYYTLKIKESIETIVSLWGERKQSSVNTPFSAPNIEVPPGSRRPFKQLLDDIPYKISHEQQTGKLSLADELGKTYDKYQKNQVAFTRR